MSDRVTLRLTLWGRAKLFSTVAAPFRIPTSNVGRLQFLQNLTNTCYFYFSLIPAVLGNMTWYLAVAFDLLVSSMSESLRMLPPNIHYHPLCLNISHVFVKQLLKLIYVFNLYHFLE